MVAVGGATVADVLSPSETLGDSDRFAEVSGSLGEDVTPSFFLDFAPILSLAESTGQASSDPDYQMAKPYLDALDYFVAGSKVDGDRSMASIVLGIKERRRARAPRPWSRRRDNSGEILRFASGTTPVKSLRFGSGFPGWHATGAGSRGFGLGIDLIEIERIERAIARRPRLADRLFRPGELAYAATRARPARHLAARFAAKEAAIKALGGGCGPRDIEVVGAAPPTLLLHGGRERWRRRGTSISPSRSRTPCAGGRGRHGDPAPELNAPSTTSQERWVGSATWNPEVGLSRCSMPPEWAESIAGRSRSGAFRRST